MRAEPGTRRSTPPLAVERRLQQLYPQASVETGRVIELYLEESFAERQLDARELAEVREALKTARRKWKRSA